MENNFAGKTACSLSYPGARVKIEKSFSPKLTDYFIQGVRNSYPAGIFLGHTLNLYKIYNLRQHGAHYHHCPF
jgi:hypothetical protein